MKRSLIILILAFSTVIANSQIVFNRIVEDTFPHIMNSVIDLDTGYIVLTGTRNESAVRSFALTYVNSNGDIIWKNIIGNDSIEFWEGKINCIKRDHQPYSVASTQNTGSGLMDIRICKYDSVYNLIASKVVYSGYEWKKGFNIIKSRTDNYYVTGAIYDSELDDVYMYLVKTDSSGNDIWSKTYGQRNETGEQIIETSDSCILIGGHTFSFPVTITDEDWYLIKVDTAGTVIWEKGFGNGSLYDGGVSGIIETQDSNYIACGGYPAFEVAGNSFFDGCLRKVSRDGVLMWTRYYRLYSLYSTNITTMKDYINSIYEDTYGNLYTLSSTYDAKPFYRGALTKMDCNGNIMFRKIYYAIDEFSNEQYLNVMKPTNDGGFILAGYGNSYDWYGYSPPQQAWLIKTDSLGIDGLCYTEPPALNIDLVLPETVNCNDTITVYAYIAGKSAPYTIETSIGQVIDSIYYPPVFVPVEIGLSQTSVEIGGIEYYSELITEATLSNHEWGQCIAKPVEFYTPHTSGNQQINITVTDAYGESKTITKEVFVNDCGQSVAGVETCPVKLYPNPARDIVYIDIPDEINCKSFEIYNSMGQILLSKICTKSTNVIDIREFSSGNYLVKLFDDNNNSYSISFEKQ